MLVAITKTGSFIRAIRRRPRANLVRGGKGPEWAAQRELITQRVRSTGAVYSGVQLFYAQGHPRSAMNLLHESPSIILYFPDAIIAHAPRELAHASNASDIQGGHL
ncbi:hypothetical protein EVAR_78126_1 [Eumeta japonica]|uniref:Uncharacterized protein n=1 Tax=Eumeta variegata TaxID=151549 RepID=A0A4C1T0J1_EUMVA|nr:hypothetical protein EVAR_78126_1 [Eumeta japonica]